MCMFYEIMNCQNRTNDAIMSGRPGTGQPVREKIPIPLTALVKSKHVF